MAHILDEIVARKREEVARAKAATPRAALEARLAGAGPVRDFRAALLCARGLAVIAEVKKASPSAGVLCHDFDPVRIARVYASGGAHAVSVLTDRPFFQGELAHLSAVRAAIYLPVLRKDFVIDEQQLLEARAAGADCVLLIAEILAQPELTSLLGAARRLGMEALVEIHDQENLPRALDAGATLIGVNNRDLRTFVTRLEHTLELARKVPREACLVSESGIRSRDDLRRLEDAGVRAVLIGETLMRAPDAGAKLRELLGDRG